MRDNNAAIEVAINARAPIAGIGLKDDLKPDGIQLSVDAPRTSSADGEQQRGSGASSPGGSGVATVIATEFVDAANAETDGDDELLYSHEIGANRLVTNGDCIRAVYAVYLATGEDLAAQLGIRFGDGGDLGASEILRSLDFTIAGVGHAKLEALVMRKSDILYRALTSILISDDDGTELVQCVAGTDQSISSFAEGNKVISLWCALSGTGASAGLITARMALIEYIPA